MGSTSAHSFLGAGAILRSSTGEVSGHTTAASLWAMSAIGMAIGNTLEAVAGVYLLQLTVSDGRLHIEFTRETQTSGRFVSRATAVTLFSYDIPAAALITAAGRSAARRARHRRSASAMSRRAVSSTSST